MSVAAEQDYSHPRQRVINGAADAQFAVGSAPVCRRLRQEDTRDQFVFLQLAIVVTDAGVEVTQGKAPRARDTGDFDFGLQAEQRRRCVAREGRPAGVTAGSHVADVAVLLDAESATFAPRSEERRV